MRPLTVKELEQVAGGLYSSDSNTGIVAGGGDSTDPSAGSNGSGTSSDSDIDVSHSAIFAENMDAVDSQPTGFSYIIPVMVNNGGGGNSRGYDSADYNGSTNPYDDYFASQHGPDTIEYRASISAEAFNNYAQNHDNINTDLGNIIEQSSDVDSANYAIHNYLNSIGLSGQLDASIDQDGFSASHQSLVSHSNDVVVNGLSYRVTDPNTFLHFGQEGNFVLASMNSMTSGSDERHGSSDNAAYDTKHGLYVLPKHLSEEQKIAVVYNETKGIQDSHDRAVVAALITEVINNNDGRHFEAASPVAELSNSIDKSVYASTVNAVRNYQSVISGEYGSSDPARGATNWIMRSTSSTSSWLGLPDQGQYGPFDAAGTSAHYVNFFRDPAYAK